MRHVLMGLLVALASALVLSLMMGLVFYLGPLSERNWSLMAHLLSALSVFLGGWWAAHGAGGRGLLYGGAVGLLFWGCTLAVGLISGVPAIVPLMKKALLCWASGALGGMAGVAF